MHSLTHSNMRARFIQLGFLFRAPDSVLHHPVFGPNPPILNLCRYWATFPVTAPPLCETPDGAASVGEDRGCPNNSGDVLRRWGCSDTEISKIFHRRPALRKADVHCLQSKLNLLSELGLTGSHLVRIINCRPRFLSNNLKQCLDERLEYLEALFGSREALLKAIVRNPSLLTYDLHDKIKPVVDAYYQMGFTRKDLVPMLLSRPTLIPRTSLNDEKLDFIRRTGISKDSKMYKYVVTLTAISRIETLHEKLANLEKFGFSEQEVFGLFGRSPFILTLSVDKVQRNMTFVLGTMKLSAKAVLDHPFLLLSNLEAVLKPRFLLAGKIEDMDLVPQIKGPLMLRALRMVEMRFVKAFIKCHQNAVSDELMEFYTNAKCVKRLAESSKKTVYKGFPF
ncbi:transcription termination factor MTERF15, mitochondrial [Diospyros lotus]|uniref:transcription termination factor MTERF15, mitochondrial n=1 Tax=Diospyros lotus TaxID=55363 RepID=UPI0022550315|nr:transcription termination factor MTERF15, mitochondrial [Diospyros lotus]XP_052178301.1 transcription termination factor MTERF15, mitochondrial [Diospyros lotus]XP_052178302.1 transcription termination factor MTERF15, mitochondrial [Diospyros lotus]XP_052178303.1 transcription termination factor MTERF15, mitochondrial [Diospyros lotus]